MQCVGETVYWCPRCGTIRQTAIRLDHVPTLVKRCRLFAKETQYVAESVTEAWQRLGIEEAIREPANATTDERNRAEIEAFQAADALRFKRLQAQEELP